jgi:hypothetical protein
VLNNKSAPFNLKATVSSKVNKTNYWTKPLRGR